MLTSFQGRQMIYIHRELLFEDRVALAFSFSGFHVNFKLSKYDRLGDNHMQESRRYF